MSEQRFSIRKDWSWARYRILFGEKTSDGKWALAQTAVLKVSEDPGEEASALLMVEEPALQSLMDELWTVGIRPRDIGSAGHLAATQAHLKDMKTLVSKAYDIQL